MKAILKQIEIPEYEDILFNRHPIKMLFAESVDSEELYHFWNNITQGQI